MGRDAGGGASGDAGGSGGAAVGSGEKASADVGAGGVVDGSEAVAMESG